jgi:TPR repeat protein
VQFRRYILLILTFLLLQACAASITTQQLQSGKANFDSGNFKLAFHQMLPLAAAGNSKAQYAVGYMYYYGYGVTQDSESGLFWINKAAIAHYTPAITALALIQQKKPFVKEKTNLNSPVLPPVAQANTQVTAFCLYTLQLLGNYDLASVKQLQQKLHAKNSTYIRQTQYQGRAWYVLTYGQYPAISHAALAKLDLPKKIKNLNPWIRKCQGLQEVN